MVVRRYRALPEIDTVALVRSKGRMSQATLGSAPYRNSNPFSGYYLEERVDDLEGWDCDSEAEAAFEALRELWAQEGDLVAGYKEDELLAAWVDEVLDVLGFGSLSHCWITIPRTTTTGTR